MGTLYREPGKVVWTVSASGESLPARPAPLLYAAARGRRRRQPRPRKPSVRPGPADRRPFLTRPRILDGDPRALWNCYGFGPSREFDWLVLWNAAAA